MLVNVVDVYLGESTIAVFWGVRGEVLFFFVD